MTREDEITASAPCPTCGSAAGTKCYFNARERLGSRGEMLQRDGDVHHARRPETLAMFTGLRNSVLTLEAIGETLPHPGIQPHDRDLILEIIHDLDRRVLQAQTDGNPQSRDSEREQSAALRRLLAHADEALRS